MGRIAAAALAATLAFAIIGPAAAEDLRFKVVAQSVVRASDERVQALLFLDQYVSRRRPQPGAQEAGSVPFAALVTVVSTDHGWLVSAIDTTV